MKAHIPRDMVCKRLQTSWSPRGSSLERVIVVENGSTGAIFDHVRPRRPRGHPVTVSVVVHIVRDWSPGLTGLVEGFLGGVMSLNFE
jgi:hypothetical protein